MRQLYTHALVDERAKQYFHHAEMSAFSYVSLWHIQKVSRKNCLHIDKNGKLKSYNVKVYKKNLWAIFSIVLISFFRSNCVLMAIYIKFLISMNE